MIFRYLSYFFRMVFLLVCQLRTQCWQPKDLTMLNLNLSRLELSSGSVNSSKQETTAFNFRVTRVVSALFAVGGSPRGHSQWDPSGRPARNLYLLDHMKRLPTQYRLMNHPLERVYDPSFLHCLNECNLRLNMYLSMSYTRFVILRFYEMPDDVPFLGSLLQLSLWWFYSWVSENLKTVSTLKVPDVAMFRILRL